MFKFIIFTLCTLFLSCSQQNNESNSKEDYYLGDIKDIQKKAKEVENQGRSLN